MAKKKNSVDLDMNVKGKGVKKTTVQMKQLGDQTEKVSKSTAEANRNWKGASKQSSGASKNFSKMSQGMGGIVGAYATLAANIFAIGAAFRFLESAGDLQKLKEGQVLYASATGVALKSLTNDIIAATDAQITFANASQSAAIGKAAGLTNDQLTRLGKGAKDASIILGRDVTDSFNRLIRGVTKAEPELLDELGIILRLNDATEKYASTIGKSAQDLTQFEKSQAVTVEVLDQVESKYGRIMAVMEPSGNQFTKLGKAFDDIVNHIKEFSAAIATPIAGVLTEQPLLIAGILLALGNTLINTGLTQWTKDAGDAAKAYGVDLDNAKAKLAALQAQGELKSKGSAKAALGLQAAAQKQGAIPEGFKAKSWQMAAAGEGEKLTSQQLVGMKASVTAHKTMHKDIKASWIQALDEMLLKSKATTKGIDLEFQKSSSWFEVQTARMKVAWAGTMSFIKSAAAATGKFITRAFSILSWVSILYTMGKAAFDWFKGVRDGGEAVEETITPMDIATEKVKALNEEFEKFNAVQRIITEDGHGFLQFFEAMGNKIGSLSVSMQKTLLEGAGEGFSEFLDQTRNEFIVMQNELAQEGTKNLLGFDGMKFGEAEEELKGIQERIDELRKGTQTVQVPYTNWYGGTSFMDAGIERDPESVASLERVSALQREYDSLERQLGKARLAQEAYNGSMIAFMRVSDDEGLNAYADFYDDMLESAKVAAEAFDDKADNPITAYLEELQKLEKMEGRDIGGEAWKELLKSIFEAQTAAQAFGATITEVTRLQTENQQEAAKLLTDTQKRSTEGRMVDSLERELELRLELNQAGFDAPAGMSDEEKDAYKKRGDRLQQELDLFRLIDTMKADAEKRTKAQTAVEKRMLTGQTKLVAARLKLEMSLMKNDDKRLKIESDIEAVTRKIALNNGIMEPQQRDMLELSMLELANLEAQNRELERKLDYTSQIKDSAAQAFESGLQKTFASFIKGEESSLTDAMRSLAEGIFNAVADTIAKQLTETVMGLFGIETEAQQMKNALIEGADYWVTVVGNKMKADADLEASRQPQFMVDDAGNHISPYLDPGGNDFGASLGMSQGTFTDDASLQKLLGIDSTPDTIQSKTIVDVYNALKEQTDIFNSQRGVNVNTTGERGGEPLATERYLGGKGGPSADEIFNTPDSLKNPRTKEERDFRFFEHNKIGDDLRVGPEKKGVNNQSDRIDDAPLLNLFNVDSAWMTKLGGFFGEESSFLSSLGGLFGGLDGILGGLAGGGPGGGIMGLLSFIGADGGIVKGGFRKYAKGGIATSPTLGLIGEGQHNEAVVPLPDGKAIPVDMRSSAQNNNVTVNVSGDSQQTQVSGQDNEGLGIAIAKAVQEELQNQKRAGGILNKYGTA